MNVVPGKMPTALTVTGVAAATSQPPCPFAFARHSTRNKWSFGVKFAPDTVTVEPLVSFFEGFTVSDGALAIDAFGITSFEGAEIGLVPTLFRATTVNVYDFPFVNPEIVHVVVVELQVRASGCDVTT